MLKVKVSSKRQVTFPSQVCQSLGIKPGDDLLLDRRVEDGEEIWSLIPARQYSRPWMGSLRKYAVGKKHDMSAIRRSIANRRAAGES